MVEAPPKHVKVLVIGGGPAGSYAATVLAREGIDVALFEAAQFPRYHVGESLIPSIRHYLRFIGAEEKIEQYGFTRKPGSAIKFNQFKREGYTDFVALGHNNNAWNVTRAEFDHLLLQHARSCGVKVYEQTRVVGIQFDETSPPHSPTSPTSSIFSDSESDSLSSSQPSPMSPIPTDPGRPISVTWTRILPPKPTSTPTTTPTVEHGEPQPNTLDPPRSDSEATSGSTTFTHLIDATGRSGLLSTRYLRNRRFSASLRNVAVWGYWKNAGVYGTKGRSDDGETGEEGRDDGEDEDRERIGAPWFEALTDESGWAWFIPLHDGTTSIGIVLDQKAWAAARTSASTSRSPLSPDSKYSDLSSTAPRSISTSFSPAAAHPIEDRVTNIGHARTRSSSLASFFARFIPTAPPPVPLVPDHVCSPPSSPLPSHFPSTPKTPRTPTSRKTSISTSTTARRTPLFPAVTNIAPNTPTSTPVTPTTPTTPTTPFSAFLSPFLSPFSSPISTSYTSGTDSDSEPPSPLAPAFSPTATSPSSTANRAKHNHKQKRIQEERERLERAYRALLPLAPGVVELLGEEAILVSKVVSADDDSVKSGKDDERNEKPYPHYARDEDSRGYLENLQEPLVRTASEFSYSAPKYAGPGYRIVGDAGAFIDPFFSSGIHLALTSALAAAASICAVLRPSASPSSDISEHAAAEWHTRRVATSYTRFQVVVLSAYKQIRAQRIDVLSDVDEDNYDRAFALLRPVIQGAGDMGTQLSEHELQKSLDFCVDLFNPTTPAQHARVVQSSVVPNALTDVTQPLVDPRAFIMKLRGEGDILGAGEEEETEMVLRKINARRVVHAEYALNNLEAEPLEGHVVRLERGRLGLVEV